MFKKFNNFINENINSMVYGPERKHDLPLIAIDELPLITPPSNDSDETKSELEILAALPQPDEFDKSVDSGFSWVFAEYLARQNDGPGANNPSTKEIERYSKKIKHIVIALKNHFNRPRPEQLAKYHGVDLGKVYKSKTSNSASYPSGHTVQPFAIAKVLSEQYPDLKTELYNLADQIAKSRMKMRIHYPSDYEYGKKLGEIIGSRLKF